MHNILEQIRAKDARPDTPYEATEWGVTFHLRPVTAGQLSTILDLAKRDAVRADYELLSLSVLDTGGGKVFATADDAMGLSPAPVGRLLAEVVRVNGMGPEQAAKKKQTSEPTPPA